MDAVAFYHDDPSTRIAAAYDPQSSPGSVDSISSTDAGPICAIASVPPAYRDQRFGTDLAKAAILKGMNLQIPSVNTTYSSSQHLAYDQPSSIVSRDSYQQSNSYEPASSIGATTANNFSLNIPDDGVITSSAFSTPEVVNMLKVGSSDVDQMLLQYSQAGPQMSSQAYPRNLSQEQELYYARDLARHKGLGGSNPDLVRSSDTPQHSAITSGASVLVHPHQYVSPDSYYNRDQPNDRSPSGIFGVSGSTVHHMGNPGHFQPGHSGILSPHVSLIGQPVKEELPQTVPVIPNRTMSPIDMEHQEVIKTERKRMRNRLAASKCRKRKLERISRLEEKVNNLKTQNLELSTNANLLRQQVTELKSKVMAHVNSGCQLMMSQQQVAF